MWEVVCVSVDPGRIACEPKRSRVKATLQRHDAVAALRLTVRSMHAVEEWTTALWINNVTCGIKKYACQTAWDGEK